jgi:hypothetical protein
MASRRAACVVCLVVAASWYVTLGAAPAIAQPPLKLGVYAVPNDLARELERVTHGVRIYHVVPASPAGQAGLRPGDVITAIDGRPIREFQQISAALRNRSTEHPLAITFERGGVVESARIAPVPFIGELNEAAYRATLGFLRSLQKNHDGPVLTREIIDVRWELGERTAAVADITRAVARFSDDTTLKEKYLDLLRKTGQFESYVENARELAKRYPHLPTLLVHVVETLLAEGRTEEADLLAMKLAGEQFKRTGPTNPTLVELVRRWVIARLRLGRSLEVAPEFRSILPGIWSNPALGVPAFWRDALAGRDTYQLLHYRGQTEVELKQARVLFGLVPFRMHGISVMVNGVHVPLAIVDTGASHTLLSERSAKAAGIAIGDIRHEASGSLSFSVRPGFIRELRLGDLVLRDVPVTVGNPPPLVVTKAEAAIGLDLMHHLRFTIDYARLKVRAEPANRSAAPNSTDAWNIPLWLFSDHCLTVGRMPNDSPVRVLIDSGNFAHTLVWPIWAKSNIANHPGPTGSMLGYALANPRHTLRGLSIGGRKLPDWPVTDMPPVTLQGIDLLDVLMGHDLLSQYTVTIDLRNRALRLTAPDGKKLKNPIAPKPGLF